MRAYFRRRVGFGPAVFILILLMIIGALSEAERAVAVGPERVALVDRVIDGDTFTIRSGERVRVRNFDTPELRRYGCAAEREQALAARAAAMGLLDGAAVNLSVAYLDRYDRLVADVEVIHTERSFDFAEAMVESGHGAHWDYGNEPQPEWCVGQT